MGQSLQKKKIESGQGSLDDRASRKRYQEFLEKAEKFFQKEKFGSARHHLVEAHQIYPSEEVQKRIQVCEENARRVAQAQELVKQGYQLEREKKLKEALKVFQLSLNAWENKEIRTLVAKLQSKLPKPSLAPGRQAEADQRYAQAIERYREALEFEENPVAKDRLGICLVKQEAYAEAARLLEFPPSQDPEVHYYAGYALARLGRYSEALRAWEMIDQGRHTPEFIHQKQKLLETATRDILHKSRLEEKFDQAWQEAIGLRNLYPGLPLVRDCFRSVCLYRLDELWLKEKFKAMLDFCVSRHLLPRQDGEEIIEDFLPFILAKVYYRLAETNAAEYLPEAIAFWLTVIHNPKYLLPLELREREDPAAAAGQVQLTRDLQQRLEQLVQDYKTSQEEADQEKEERLQEILLHWEMERNSIDFLSEIAQQDSKLADALCTPSFAERFGLSSPVLEGLQGIKSFRENDERFWIVGALFSPARRSLLLLHQDKLEEAVAALPAQRGDEFVDYCRQRIFFRLGMERLQKGETNLKKYFSQAISLIQRFTKYEKDIIRLAQGIGYNLQKLISMDEALQILIRHSKSGELLEIASYIMSYKANALYSEGLIKAQDVERVCKKALELFPGNKFARESLQEMQSNYFMEELDSALSKANMKKAATITINSKSDEVEEAFFKFVDLALDELSEASLDREKKIILLRDLYLNCKRVNPSHPVLDEITEEIESLK